MGLGGYLCWTATAREIIKSAGDHSELKILPVEQHGHFLKVVDSEIFQNNHDFIDHSKSDINNNFIFPMVLNNTASNYCKNDTPTRAYHRTDKHIIEQYCEVYGIDNPQLKCYLNLTGTINSCVESLHSTQIVDQDFITIEPVSKDSYTENRVYPFEKWQNIVNELSDKTKVVQVGSPGSRILENVISLVGKTNFLEAAGIIGKSQLFLSSEGGLVHAATAFNTRSLVVITGYQAARMVAYPQNININIATHGPCGLKTECKNCKSDADAHDWHEIVKITTRELGL